MLHIFFENFHTSLTVLIISGLPSITLLFLSFLQVIISLTKFTVNVKILFFFSKFLIFADLTATNVSSDFKKILREPDNSLIKQYKALLKTEKINLEFTDDGIESIAELATEVNSSVENIGARRLHTIIEKVLDEISFTATDRGGEKIIINKEYVHKNLGELVKDTDLSKFIL